MLADSPLSPPTIKYRPFDLKFDFHTVASPTNHMAGENVHAQNVSRKGSALLYKVVVKYVVISSHPMNGAATLICIKWGSESGVSSRSRVKLDLYYE